jgi:membrane protein DedA with SNARE-associated domain
MEATIEQHGVLILFGIVALQAMGIPGLPGKTALVTAAVLAASGRLRIGDVIVATAIAGIVGGYLGYAWGRAGGRRLLERPVLARRLVVPLALADRFFVEHGAKAVFGARFLPGLKVIAAPAAGIARMAWPSFVLWHSLGALGFALVFGLGGYYVGRAAIELVERIGIYAVTPVAVAAVLAWLVYVALRRRRLQGEPRAR